MRFSILASVAALAACTYAAPATTAHVLHERRDYLAPSWTKAPTAAAAADAIVPVRIGITQSNLDRGHDLLMEISEHDSPKYGKHYSEEEVNDIFAPSAEAVDAVRAWLESAGIAKDRISQSFNKQWLQFDSAIRDLEDLLRTKYHVFQNPDGVDHLACDEYHVPGHIQHHIDYITPGVAFIPLRKRDASVTKRGLQKPHKKSFKLPLFPKELPMQMDDVKTKSKSNDLSLCDAVMSPQCIKALYNITKGTGASAGNVLGIFEGLGNHYSQEDLNEFFKAVYPEIPQGTHPTFNGIDGATGPLPVSEAGNESDLDFQISYPIIWPSQSVLFQTDDNAVENNYTYVGFLNNFFYGIDGSYCTTGKQSPLDPQYPDPLPGGYKGKLQCGKYKPTDVISISYGGAEISLPVYYQRRQCNEIMKLGMRGISVVVSSGDYGVAIGSAQGCIALNETSPANIFAPDFPATCPYITALGSTFLPPGANVKKDQEVATTRFASGGGFSNLYPPPKYQKAAVEGYLTKYPPPYNSYATLNQRNIGANGGVYNSVGRGFPDFAAIGDNVLYYNLGRPQLVGGTSAAAPAFAAILARINVERVAAGKSTVGFVNPTLYANPQVLHDITVGNNPGCNTTGFAAAPGWDPVTGMGTPDFPKMLELFLSLP